MIEELSVPSILEDFEIGDRVWYQSDNRYAKIFGTVSEVSNTGVLLKTDAGSNVYIRSQWDAKESGNVLSHSLQKSLLATDVVVGNILSKRIQPGLYGIAVRIHARVEEVIPGVKIIVGYEDAPGTGEFTYRTFNGEWESIEQEMAGWELE